MKEHAMTALQWLATQLAWEQRLTDLRRDGGDAELVEAPAKAA